MIDCKADEEYFEPHTFFSEGVGRGSMYVYKIIREVTHNNVNILLTITLVLKVMVVVLDSVFGGVSMFPYYLSLLPNSTYWDQQR